MEKRELLARIAILLILFGIPAAVLAHQYIYLPTTHGDVKVIDVGARAPEAGGWSPDFIRVNKGDTVRLRITAHDVVHGFAIGRMGIDLGHIVPGEVVMVEFVADTAGRFTYYCNVWCSPYHYRMRGTLEVVDPGASGILPATDEETDFPGLDIDSPHEAEFYPGSPPSPSRGQALADQVDLPSLGDLRRQSPSLVFEAIRGENLAASFADEEVWDLVAYLWSVNTTPERLETGELLYGKNCVGCHGLTGNGAGPGSHYLGDPPTDFTDPKTMAGGTSQIYYAKTRRGGMGTGMPYWGSIFTEEETWNIVDYLWTFLFKDTEAE